MFTSQSRLVGIDKNQESKTDLKGRTWKSTYHNFRGLTNSMETLMTK
ncbi:hypothetical protein KO566_13480 [Flavobacteriaceae bacterium XHP0103]|nr:hypothetical protein [Marixanthotalea marina]MBU3823072.1 hypothetical protein [Marixanthotalea marina]